MQFRSNFRQPALYLAGLAVFLLMILAACGGGDDGDDGDTAPAATTVPAATAPPAAPAATAAAPAQSDSSSGSERLFISANETSEITVNLVAGDVLEVTFEAASNITGGANVSAGIGGADEGVQLVIRDPVETSLVTIDETTASDTVTVEAEVNGEHLMLFFNPFPLQAATVDVSWTVNP